MKLVSVFMVHDMAFQQCEKPTNNGSGYPHALPISNKRACPGTSLKPCSITVIPAKNMLRLADMGAESLDNLLTAITTNLDAAGFGRIHASVSDDLMDSLPGKTVSLGKFDHRDKIKIGFNYVNSLLTGCLRHGNLHCFDG